MTRPATLEVPVDSIEVARQLVGQATRLEVCSDLGTEGWTPELELFQRVVELAKPAGTQVFALIRPRIGEIIDGSDLKDFKMSPARLDASLASIDRLAAAGADGVAIGPLLPDGRIDQAACSQLAERAASHELAVSVLRSIDLVPDRERTLQFFNEIGVVRILTTGSDRWKIDSVSLAVRTRRLAADVEICRRLAKVSGRVAIEVMCGGGVRSANADEFLAVSPHLHSSCRYRGRFDREELDRLSCLISRAGGRS